MNISILIPWRSDGPDGHRQKIWNYLRPLWEKTPFEICVGEDDLFGTETTHPTGSCEGDSERHAHVKVKMLPFNAAQAFNRAAEKATGDVFVLMGADLYPNVEAVLRAGGWATRRPGWAPAYRTVGYLSEAHTAALIAGEVGIYGLPFETIDYTCQGILAIQRSAWDEVGGMDERYAGWGWEDTDLIRRLTRKFGDIAAMPPVGTQAISLWHDISHRDLTYNNPNRRRFESEGK